MNNHRNLLTNKNKRLFDNAQTKEFDQYIDLSLNKRQYKEAMKNLNQEHLKIIRCFDNALKNSMVNEKEKIVTSASLKYYFKNNGHRISRYDVDFYCKKYCELGWLLQIENTKKLQIGPINQKTKVFAIFLSRLGGYLLSRTNSLSKCLL